MYYFCVIGQEWHLFDTLEDAQKYIFWLKNQGYTNIILHGV